MKRYSAIAGLMLSAVLMPMIILGIALKIIAEPPTVDGTLDLIDATLSGQRFWMAIICLTGWLLIARRRERQ